MQDFSGKTYWILGASSGIGAALARELAGRGARMILSARRKDKLEALSSALGEGHLVLPVDAADPEAVMAAGQAIAGQVDHIDGAIFMAATYTPHDQAQKDLAIIHAMNATNIGGAFNMVHAILPQMQEQGFGQVVLCGSVAGYRGLPYGQPYCAAKAAIISYAESLKIELEPENIDVKVICPGFVETPLTDKNDFPMPFLITAERAAREIAKGLKSRAFEIRFPKRMIALMKVLHALPAPLYFMAGKVMLKNL